MQAISKIPAPSMGPKVIRSHQVDRTTGLTLNEQRRIDTRVRRGALFLDAAMPGWHRKKFNKGVFSQFLHDAVSEKTVEAKGYYELTQKALAAGYNIRKSLLLPTSEEIDGAKFGFYPIDYGVDELGLDKAWRREIDARKRADREARSNG